MMAAETLTPYEDSTLIQRLPAVRGELVSNAPLGKMTWFQVGGPAEALFKPADTEDLGAFLAGCPADIPLTVIGSASNLIVRDGGIPGVVIKLGKHFAAIETDTDILTAGAAALDMSVAQAAARAGISGLEFLIGIPGSIGGAVRMNAGCYGSETVDVLVSARIFTRDGLLEEMTPDEIGMSYRRTGLAPDSIVVSATLKGAQDNPAAIQARMAEIKAARSESQPLGTKTGGSTFANPSRDNPEIKESAWQLIDAAGCRGLKIGGAQMSEKHCNFMINTGGATAADLEMLGEEVRRRVKKHSGVELRWEIRRIGVPADFETRGNA